MSVGWEDLKARGRGVGGEWWIVFEFKGFREVLLLYFMILIFYSIFVTFFFLIASCPEHFLGGQCNKSNN